MGDPVSDTFHRSSAEFILDTTYQQATVQNGRVALLDKIAARGGRPYGHLPRSTGL